MVLSNALHELAQKRPAFQKALHNCGGLRASDVARNAGAGAVARNLPENIMLECSDGEISDEDFSPAVSPIMATRSDLDSGHCTTYEEYGHL